MQDRQEQLAQIYHDLRVYLKQQGMEEPIVCGDGAVQAWMFMLGEAPGAEEVREGRPFVGKAGKRLHPTTIRNWFDELLDNAGVKHYSVHSLRHTNITLLMIAGVPVVTVSNRVGHSKSMTTLNVYADYLGSSDLEASSKINQYFSEKKEIILKAE